MEHAKKMQIKDASVRTLLMPDDFKLDAPVSDDGTAVLAFVTQASDLAKVEEALNAARADGMAWIAYPKAGKLGTDLNRDKLWALLKDEGVRPVRQISLDDTWSALRLRPGA